MRLTAEQVEALAPDTKAIAAARKLARPQSWQGLGHDEEALWGECRGSALYRTKVDLGHLVASCTCPSRKFPCKHALALMFLAASAADAVPTGARPDWVSEWLDKRRGAADKKAARAAATTEPPDPVARAKRTAARQQRIEDGLAVLDEWMNDVVRHGLARMQPAGERPWDEQARRLIDAQAPGVAARLRRVGALVGAGPDWPARVVDGLGAIALLTEAYRRRDALDPAEQADLMQQIGVNVGQDEVLAHGERVADRWLVLGQVHDEDERVRVQRTWLRAQRSGRFALVVQFAAGAAPFAQVFVPGTAFDGEMAFYPSAWPQRCLVVERGPQSSAAEAPAACDGIEAGLERAAAAAARSPWNERTPMLLGPVRPAQVEGGRAALCDASGAGLRIDRGDTLTLFAISGGEPVQVAAEWNGRDLDLLGVFWPDGYAPLTRRHDADGS